ncbi:MAG: class I adenylate-forming enzyme family protein [Chloroflexi bacterium]|nr:class I adenylate-forming enzyme family protein [Chloroflexota bacterium]
MSINIGQFLDTNVWQYGEYKHLIYLGHERECSLTNKQILERARALATGLKTRGIKKGDIVASVLSNIPEIHEIANAITRIGAVYMPIIFMLTPPEIRYILEDSKCKIVFTEDKLLDKVREAASGLNTIEKIICIGKTASTDVVPYDDLQKVSDERGNILEVSKDDLALIMYAPGTTGHPRGVMLTHFNMYSQIRSGVSVWGTDKGEALVTTIPMNHIYGLLACFEGYVAGIVNILMPPFDPRKVLDVVRKFRVKVLPVVPTMLNFMLMVWDPGKDDLSSLDFLMSSGSYLSLETLHKVQNTFVIEITQSYGCTEVGGTISLQRKDWPRKPGSTGFPIPGFAVKIINDEGQEVTRGQEGEIICKGPMVMKGYMNKPRETAEVLKNGWFYTGDIGRFDEDGELYVTGRKKDIIIKGGENIDPAIAEGWLSKHPAILENSVFAIDDEKYGEEIAASIVLKPGCNLTEEEILHYLGQHMHHFVLPKKIFFMESLPRTSIGRVLKKEIRRIVNEFS